MWSSDHEWMQFYSGKSCCQKWWQYIIMGEQGQIIVHRISCRVYIYFHVEYSAWQPHAHNHRGNSALQSFWECNRRMPSVCPNSMRVQMLIHTFNVTKHWLFAIKSWLWSTRVLLHPSKFDHAYQDFYYQTHLAIIPQALPSGLLIITQCIPDEVLVGVV